MRGIAIGVAAAVGIFGVTWGALGEPGGESPLDTAGLTGDIKPVLYVTDAERAASFYRDVLGFAFIGFANENGEPYYAEMSAGSTKFGLHEGRTPAEAKRIGMQRIYFRVMDITSQRGRVADRGGAPSDQEITDWMDMFTVKDPDGNEIVFAATDPSRHRIDPWSTGEVSAPVE